MRKKHYTFVAAFAMSAAGLFAADAPAATETTEARVAPAAAKTSSYTEAKTVAYGDESSSRHHMMSDHSTSGEHFNDTYEQVKGKTITPNAGPVVSGGVDFFVSADFIYWYTSFGKDNDYTLFDSFDNDTVRVSGVTRQSAELSGLNKLSPGFKVAVGLDLNYDGWDTMLEYTWLRPKNTKITDTSGDLLLQIAPRRDPTFVDPELIYTFQRYKRSWRLSFNTMNWELGRSFFVSPKLVLRTHMGLKGAWQSQRYNRDLTDGAGLIDDATVTTGSHRIREKQHYWGLGFRGGLDMTWMFSRNWSMFGKMALSPLWGRFKTERKDFNDTADVRTTGNDGRYTFNNVLVQNNRDFFHSVNMVYDFQMGIRWDYFFNDNDYRLRLEAAWEEQVWENFRQFMSYTGAHENNPNTFQGLTIKARFDF